MSAAQTTHHRANMGRFFWGDPDLSVSPPFLTFTTSNRNQGQEVTVAL